MRQTSTPYKGAISIIEQWKRLLYEVLISSSLEILKNRPVDHLFMNLKWEAEVNDHINLS